MTEAFDLKQQGFKEINDALKKLPKFTAGKIVISATRAGGRVIRKEAEAKAPMRRIESMMARGNPSKKHSKRSSKRRMPGFLAKNIVLKLVKKVSGFVHLQIGTSKAAYYGHMLEFGTKYMAPRPWLRPAYEAKKAEVLKEMEKFFWRGIKRETKKLNKAKARG